MQPAGSQRSRAGPSSPGKSQRAEQRAGESARESNTPVLPRAMRSAAICPGAGLLLDSKTLLFSEPEEATHKRILANHRNRVARERAQSRPFAFQRARAPGADANLRSRSIAPAITTSSGCASHGPKLAKKARARRPSFAQGSKKICRVRTLATIRARVLQRPPKNP
jgi:hypothetical protein